MTKGEEDIKAERARQQAVEGYDEAHDDKHTQAQLFAAAYCFYQRAVNQCGGDVLGANDPAVIPDGWPWEDEHWKPKASARQNFIVAGALALAECERLERLATRDYAAGGTPGPDCFNESMELLYRSIGCINDVDAGRWS